MDICAKKQIAPIQLLTSPLETFDGILKQTLPSSSTSFTTIMSTSNFAE